MARNYRFFPHNSDTITLLALEKDFIFDEKSEPEIFFQLTKVLRAKAGDQVTLLPFFSGENAGNIIAAHGKIFFEYSYEITEIQKKMIGLRFCQKSFNNHELAFALNLVLCLPNKPDKLEFILQKSVEIGVKKIILVESDFSQLKHQLRPERLRKIMIEAAEQSERAYVPVLEIDGKLSTFLQQHQAEASAFFVAMERLEKSDSSAFAMMKNVLDVEKNFNILVGPEGGFSEKEKEQIHSFHFQCFSLGKRILRMETAAIVSLGIVASLNEEIF